MHNVEKYDRMYADVKNSRRQKEGILIAVKHFFVINPAAGKGKACRVLGEAIRDAGEVSKIDYEIYTTTDKGDATRFVFEKINEKPEEATYRFYACGGDGTLAEVVNGVMKCRDISSDKPLAGIEVGCIPVGTGNDFVKNFTSPQFFRDVTKQILADCKKIDCYYCGDGRYGINMINIGFDCDVVVKAAEFKKSPLVPKKLAYVSGIGATFVKNLGCEMTVNIPEKSVSDKREFQLVSAANGGFCGGGFNSAPESLIDDGLLDVSLIKKVSRFDFLRLVGKYKKGTHLKTRLGKRVVNYMKAKSVEFIFEKPTNVCIDGDVIKMDSLKLTVIPKSIAFAIPVGCRLR